MAAALPLQGLDAWRVYLGLPMLGSRLPEGDHAAHVDAVVVDWLRRYHKRTDIEELET